MDWLLSQRQRVAEMAHQIEEADDVVGGVAVVELFERHRLHFEPQLLSRVLGVHAVQLYAVHLPAVALRLVSAEEEPRQGRIRGRVEGCDVLVTWSSAVVSCALSSGYIERAEEERRPVVSVLGPKANVVAMSNRSGTEWALPNFLACIAIL